MQPIQPGNASIQARLVVSGVDSPVDLQAAPGDTSRLYIAEKTGKIRIVQSGVLRQRAFLDISSRVSGASEEGLLGIVFHPQFQTNHRFYADYTDHAGDIHVVEFLASADFDSATSAEREILFISHSQATNHNGGQLAFGPDGYLYVGVGDGGGGGDEFHNGQNLGSLLAKILRVNVDAGSPYSIPPDNPFVNRPGARGETWDYGLRNPWRFCFDRLTGDLYIADVGQDKYEEVDFEPRGAGGKNYGWSIMEGLHCYNATTCNEAGLTLPVTEYEHPTGCSITGGYVYRGSDIPELNGVYFYGDWCTGFIRSFSIGQGKAANEQDWTSSLRTVAGGKMSSISSFGQDARGELYLVLLDGAVYKIVRK